MDPPTRSRSAILGLFLLLACRAAPSAPTTLPAAIGRALAILPWTHSIPAGPALCPTLAPCDTLWLEPRVVRLPNPAPAFFVPDARPTQMVLADSLVAAVPELARLGRVVRYGGWSECLAQRHDAGWPTYRRACVAFAVAGDTLIGDTLHLALLVLSPASGLRWPRVRLVSTAHGWQGTLVSMGGE
jgi:hypothetical protein